MRDDVLEEIYEVRRKISEECDYDFVKMGDLFKRAQEKCRPELLVTDKVPKGDPEPALTWDSDDEDDEIVAEVRAARAKIAAECGHDQRKLRGRLMRSQEEHREGLVTHIPTAEPEPRKADE
jgi:hypothetical protein